MNRDRQPAGCYESNLFFFLLVLWCIVSSVLLGMGIVLAETVFVLPVSISLWQLTVLSQVLSFLVPVLIYFLWTRRNPVTVLSLKPLNVKSILYILLICLFMQPGMMFLSGLSELFFSNDISSLMSELGEESFLLGLFAIAVIPATIEEITMRGVVLNGFKGQKTLVACLLNGFLFGLMHLSVQQFLYAFFAGAILSYLVRVTGSILASVLAHVVINASQFVLLHLVTMLESSDMVQEIMAETEAVEAALTFADIIPLMVAALVTVPLLYWVMGKLKKCNRVSEAEEVLIEMTEDTEQPSSRKKDFWLNWPIVAVILLYLFFVAGLPLLEGALAGLA